MTTFITPFTYIADPQKARPVSNGFVYIGRPNTDPTQTENQIQLSAVCDCDGTILTNVEQPVRTGVGGTPIVNGIPVQINIPAAEFSLVIRDRNNVQLYSSPSVTGFQNNNTFTYGTITDAIGSDNSNISNIELTDRPGSVYIRAESEQEFNNFPGREGVTKFQDRFGNRFILQFNPIVLESWFGPDNLNEAISFALAINASIVVANSGRLVMSADWNPQDEPIFARSTPNNSLLTFGRILDNTGGANRRYFWGANSFMANPSTAPLTGYSSVVQGWKVRGIDATSRQYGADGDAHSMEIISGQRSSKARCEYEENDTVLTVSEVTEFGSRFSIGDIVDGDNIPDGARITAVTKNGLTVTFFEIETVNVTSGGTGYVLGDRIRMTLGSANHIRNGFAEVIQITGNGVIERLLVTDGGDFMIRTTVMSFFGGSGTGLTGTVVMITAGFGNPNTITIDQAATGSNTVNAVRFRAEDNNNIGLLISGSGDGGTDGMGNGNGKAITIQSYGTAAYSIGLQFSGSAIRTDGAAISSANGRFNSFIRIFSTNRDNPPDYVMRLSNATFNQEVISGTGINSRHFFNTFSSTYTENIFRVNNVTAPNIMRVSNATSDYGVRFTSDNNFTFAAIFLDGQDIGTTTDRGMRIGTNQNSRIGFWGATAVQRPDAPEVASGGANIDSEARNAINSIRSSLISMGLLGTA